MVVVTGTPTATWLAFEKKFLHAGSYTSPREAAVAFSSGPLSHCVRSSSPVTFSGSVGPTFGTNSAACCMHTHMLSSLLQTHNPAECTAGMSPME